MGPFPIKCTFMESAHFCNKKPTPKDGSYVTIKGSLTDFAITPNEDFPNHVNISIENITFLGRTMVLPPLTNTPGNKICLVSDSILLTHVVLAAKHKTPAKKELTFSYDDISPMGEPSLKWFKDASGFAKSIQ